VVFLVLWVTRKTITPFDLGKFSEPPFPENEGIVYSAAKKLNLSRETLQNPLGCVLDVSLV